MNKKKVRGWFTCAQDQWFWRYVQIIEFCEMNRAPKRQKRSNHSRRVAASRRSAINARWNKPTAPLQQPIHPICTSGEGN